MRRLLAILSAAFILPAPGCQSPAGAVPQTAPAPASAPAQAGTGQRISVDTVAGIPLAEYERRRNDLAARAGDGVLLAVGAREPEHDYITFFQSSNFRYLTGFDEPEAALVMVKRGADVSATLFVLPRDPATETWSGPRLGVERVHQTLELQGRDRAELEPLLDSLLSTGLPLFVLADIRSGFDPSGNMDRALTADEQFVVSLMDSKPETTVQPVRPLVARMRGTKSAAELALIRRAIDITLEAHREALRTVAPGRNEYEVQAIIEYTFRRNGAERPAFASIVGSGPNSTILHYNRNDRVMQAGDMVVMDIGASWRGYAADVTRTLPVSGRFTAEQRAIYQLVRDAQEAAARQARVGGRAALMGDSANAVLARGLASLGLIQSPNAVYDCGPPEAPEQNRCAQLRLYYMHGLGHGIGLDVHDPDQYSITGLIAAGSAFTIEPGIYVRENLLEIIPDTPHNRRMIAAIRTAVERYRNIGVRIEDDYLATASGVEWVSRVPREIAEIEGAMGRR